MPSRRHAWPRFAGQVRQKTEDSARAYAELLQEQVLPKLEQIHKAAHTDPRLVEQLAILAQRDIALAVAALMGIHADMVNAGHGKGEA
jgi:hypothetical protein